LLDLWKFVKSAHTPETALNFVRPMTFLGALRFEMLAAKFHCNAEQLNLQKKFGEINWEILQVKESHMN